MQIRSIILVDLQFERRNTPDATINEMFIMIIIYRVNCRKSYIIHALKK